MMSTERTFTAGKWKIVLSAPWPSWVRLFFDGEPMRDKSGPNHNDLLDLQYIVNRAVDASRELIDKDSKQ